MITQTRAHVHTTDSQANSILYDEPWVASVKCLCNERVGKRWTRKYRALPNLCIPKDSHVAAVSFGRACSQANDAKRKVGWRRSRCRTPKPPPLGDEKLHIAAVTATLQR